MNLADACVQPSWWWLGTTWLLFMLFIGFMMHSTGYTTGRKYGKREGYDLGYREAKRKYKEGA